MWKIQKKIGIDDIGLCHYKNYDTKNPKNGKLVKFWTLKKLGNDVFRKKS